MTGLATGLGGKRLYNYRHTQCTGVVGVIGLRSHTISCNIETESALAYHVRILKLAGSVFLGGKVDTDDNNSLR
jgi:hypothetical protein